MDCILTLTAQNRHASLSRDPQVRIFHSQVTARLARSLMVPILIVLLLAPVVLCTYITDLAARLTIVVASMAIFAVLILSTTKAKTTELLVAGAT